MTFFCAVNSAEDCVCLQSGIELVQGLCAANFMKINISQPKVITAKLGVITFSKTACVFYWKKVNQSRYRPGQALRFPRG
jgi:hypothetical protein